MIAKRTRVLGIAIAILVVGGGVVYWTRTKGTSAETTYQTSTAEKGTLVVSISASGTVESTDRVSVTTSVTGVVADVHVKNGDTVKAGQKLMAVTLDDDSALKREQASNDLQASKNALASAKLAQTNAKADVTTAQSDITEAQEDKTNAYADYQEAKADLADAQDAADAVASLAETDATRIAKEKDLDEAETAAQQAEDKYDAAVKAVAQAKTALPNAKQKSTESVTNIAKATTAVKVAQEAYDATASTIVAPHAGTVADLTIATGATISASTSTGQGASASSTKIASILTGNPQSVTVTLEEADIPKVKSGQATTITVDAITDKTLTGKVIGVDTTGSISSGVTSYSATVQFDKVADGVLPNMAASVSIITATKSDVVLVPIGAIKTANDQTTVQVMKNGIPESINVTVGLESDSKSEIVSGVSVGDEVVTATITPTTKTNSSSSATGTSSLFGGSATRGGNTGTIRIEGGMGAPPGF
jgi:multidrug efflux pump subunit AcrA (membrane-fusion protein)